MRLLEHQAKSLLSALGLVLTKPAVATAPDAAAQAAAAIGGPVVIKAQVPFGGRGKAGGVAFADSPAQAATAAGRLLGMELRGVKVAAVSVEAKIAFTRELYVGVSWDTSAKLPVALLSAAGGVDVETGGQTRLARTTFEPAAGLPPFRGREMAAAIGLTGKTLVAVGGVLQKLAAAFNTLDAITVEINPLVETTDGELIGLDAHLEIDDDAGARQAARLQSLGPIASTGGGRPATAFELEAQRIDAMDHRGVAGRVVEFDGDLALLIGGGGASLTVFDAIQRHGGRPANYCEVGGNPTEEKVAALVALLISKPGVHKLGVIMNVVNNTRADVMARGVLMGIDKTGRDPAKTICVFRIPGSWEQEATELLWQRGVRALGREVSLDEAARMAVGLDGATGSLPASASTPETTGAAGTPKTHSSSHVEGTGRQAASGTSHAPTMLLDRQDAILVQGITGREASAMVADMLAYGSRIVSGVTPGKGGQEVHGVPVFDTVESAIAKHPATASIISVPAPGVLDAALEAIAHGVKLLLIMTERVPRLDTAKLLGEARRQGCVVIGPNTLGLIRPGIAKLGTIGGRVDNVKRSFTPGRVAILSRSGGMTTEIASFLTSHGIGQSIAVGVGGDPIIGSNFTELIALLEDDPSSDAVVIYGEPGGTAEEQLADRLKTKPSRLRINAFLSGRFVDQMEGVRFGHAAVLVEGGRGSVRGKAQALREAGVFVAERFDDILTGLPVAAGVAP